MLRFCTANCCLQTPAMLDLKRLALPALHPAILDRIIQPDTSPEIAMRCGLLSIDSTMRSNATVGPPLECLFYRNDSLDGFQHYIKLEENHPYLTRIRQTWDESIRLAFQQLPSFTEVFEAD